MNSVSKHKNIRDNNVSFQSESWTYFLFYFFVSFPRMKPIKGPTCSLVNNAVRARRARTDSGASSSGSACAREEIRDHWEDREGGETGARHSLLARHSDLSIDFHDRSRAGESERTQRTNGRGTKGERATQPPRISAARHEFQTGLRAQSTCLRAVSKKGHERGVGSDVMICRRLFQCITLIINISICIPELRILKLS